MSIRSLFRPAPLAAILLPAILCLATVPADAQGRTRAVGPEGLVYSLHEGAYGDLFPRQGLGEADSSALALDVIDGEGGRTRLLVPGTEGVDVDDSASLLFEDESNTLFVLWQTKSNVIHSRLNLVGYRDGEWSEPIEISGKPFGWKSSPQLAVTRDAFETEAEDGTAHEWSRTVLHVLWRESGPTGEPQVFYSPVTLLNGEYTGWNPVHLLDQFVDVAPAGKPGAVGSMVADAPAIEPGWNSHSVVVAFVPEASGVLVTLGIELTPGEISFLGDEARHQISEVGRSLPAGGGIGALAGKVRHQISEVGARLKLHPSVTQYLAEAAHAEILAAAPNDPVEALADRVRHQISEVGARITDRGFERMLGKSALHLLEMPERIEDGTPSLMISVVSPMMIRTAPETGGEAPTLHLSRDGGAALVSWQGKGVLEYRESLPEGWSEVRTLRLHGELDLERALQMLDRRIDESGSR
jgi:hypothetical protein